MNISEDQLHEDRLKNRWSPPLSVKFISFAAFFSFAHFSVAKMMFVQGAGAIVQEPNMYYFTK